MAKKKKAEDAFNLDGWQAVLEQVRQDKLLEITRNAIVWFEVEEELWPRYLKVSDVIFSDKKDRAEMVDFIMAGDPIAADGGLLDFLHDQHIQGLLPKP